VPRHDPLDFLDPHPLQFRQADHILQLVLGDWTHIPLVPPVMSEPITITVR